ncbi:MAG TPA: hypothetical protein PKV97_00910, partial [Thauera aminoaromatica]|nr:hypothetical protein [Thauera aminoaromatica]
MRELVVQHVLQQAPGFLAQRRALPRRRDDASEHVRPQHVVGVEFVAPLEPDHPRAQVGELPRSAVHDREREARTEDLGLYRVVVDERHGRLSEQAGGKLRA